jgi:hypothetical protein
MPFLHPGTEKAVFLRRNVCSQRLSAMNKVFALKRIADCHPWALGRFRSVAISLRVGEYTSHLPLYYSRRDHEKHKNG